MTEQTKQWLDENPNGMNTMFATTELQYMLETVMMRIYYSGQKLRTISKPEFIKATCGTCNAPVSRTIYQDNKKFTCFDCKRFARNNKK